MMILVLFSALILAAWSQLARLDPLDFVDLKPRVFLLLPFLFLVAAKLGLVLGSRSRRSRSANPTERPTGEEAGRDRSPS
jgi:hypothetical protein